MPGLNAVHLQLLRAAGVKQGVLSLGTGVCFSPDCRSTIPNVRQQDSFLPAVLPAHPTLRGQHQLPAMSLQNFSHALFIQSLFRSGLQEAKKFRYAAKYAHPQVGLQTQDSGAVWEGWLLHTEQVLQRGTGPVGSLADETGSL